MVHYSEQTNECLGMHTVIKVKSILFWKKLNAARQRKKLF